VFQEQRAPLVRFDLGSRRLASLQGSRNIILPSTQPFRQAAFAGTDAHDLSADQKRIDATFLRSDASVAHFDVKDFIGDVDLGNRLQPIQLYRFAAHHFTC